MEDESKNTSYTDFIIHSLEEISLKEQFIIFYSVINTAIKHKYYYLALPLVFYFNYLLVKAVPEIEGHGTEKVIEAIHKENGKIRWQVVPLKLITTILTLAFGGSAGKEGPCAQIGGGIASIFSGMARLSPLDRKKLVICGISGGFAAVFGTPIAGAIFGVEVLFVGTVLYDVLLPSFVAGITSYQVSRFLGTEYFHFQINAVPTFSEGFFAKIIIAGLFFGICSFLLIEFMQFFTALAKKIKDNRRPFVGGLAIILLTMIFSEKYLGLGIPVIESSLNGQMNMWYDFLLKIIFTSITLSFLGSGGIVTPIFFIGATSGTLFADLLGLNRQIFAAIGLVSLVSGAANTPIAASIMAIEMFGKDIAPFATITCVVSFLITGYRSVYPSQIISSDKCELVKSAIGKTIVNVHPEVAEDEVQKTLIGDTRNFAQTLKSKINFIEDFMNFYKKRGKKKQD